MNIICPCGKKVYVPPREQGRKKYCSKKCFYKYRVVPIWNKGLKGIHLSLATEFKKGIHYSPKTEFKKGHKSTKPIKKGQRISPKTEFTRERVIGNNNNKWKGKYVGYGGSHSWILRTYGKAKFCENRKYKILNFICNKKSKKYEWAFKNKKGHKRDKKYYFQLCHSCHLKYDRS